MTIVTTTLYYLKGFGEDPYHDDCLAGRALTKSEADAITGDETRDAIIHSPMDNRRDWDLRSSPEAARAFNLMSADELKEQLEQHNVLLLRTPEPLKRYTFPLFTEGPRKGGTDFQGESERFDDRWYCVEEEEVVVAIEGQVQLHEDGRFSVLEKAAA